MTHKKRWGILAIVALMILDALCIAALGVRLHNYQQQVSASYPISQITGSSDKPSSTQDAKTSLWSLSLPIDARERASPKDRIQENDILVFHDRAIVKIDSPRLVKYSNPQAMAPTIMHNSIVIGVSSDSVKDIAIGDIVSYEEEGVCYLARVDRTDYDSEGWYAVLKEDSGSRQADEVRADQIKEIVVAIVYSRISDVYIQDEGFVLFLDRPQWARFTDTNSMDPILDAGTHAIEQAVTSSDQIGVGDIVSYDLPHVDGTIIHRIIETGNDEQGWYAIEQGDNISTPDPGKIRAGQLQRVVSALIY